jgi:uncharacterized protein YdeI (YjbR/CyaY-like superfamily)
LTSGIAPKKRAAADLYVESRRAWRDWLEHNAEAPGTQESGIWVVIYKKDTGRQTATYGDLVEEALCFGWIDSVIRTIDATCYAQRFTPRKPDSKWSPSNIERVKRLRAAGQMQPAGEAAFVGHRHRRLAPHPTTLPPDLEREFRGHTRACEYFDACPPGYRRTTIGWVASAKKDETRRKRLMALIATSERGERMKYM